VYAYLVKNLLPTKVKDVYADFVVFSAVSTSYFESAEAVIYTVT
jgi:hypothetical protein